MQRTLWRASLGLCAMAGLGLVLGCDGISPKLGDTGDAGVSGASGAAGSTSFDWSRRLVDGIPVKFADNPTGSAGSGGTSGGAGSMASGGATGSAGGAAGSGNGTGTGGAPLVSAICGDGALGANEECDFGSVACSSHCQTRDALLLADGRARYLGDGAHSAIGADTGSAAAFGVAYIQKPVPAIHTSQGDEPAVPAAVGLGMFDRQGARLDRVDVSTGTDPVLLFASPVLAYANGAFIAAWTGYASGTGPTGGDELDVFVRGVPIDDPLSKSVRIANQATAFSQYDPDILRVGDRLVVAFTDETDPINGPDLKYRVLDATTLEPLTDDQVLADTSDFEGDVALSPHGDGFIAAWRASESDANGVPTGKEFVRVVEMDAAGSGGGFDRGTEWQVGPHLPGATADHPAVAELDSTHLALLYTVGTDPLQTGVANVARLYAAIIDVFAGSDAIQPNPVTPLDPDYTARDDIGQSHPAIVRVGDALVASWRSDSLGTAEGENIWLRTLSMSMTNVGAVLVAPPELRLPRWPEGSAGDQRTPNLAALPPDPNIAPNGALIAAWTDYGQTQGSAEGQPDVLTQFSPLPLTRSDTRVPDCSPTAQCGPGEGICVADADCETGLVCATGAGPNFGLPPGSGACVPAHCANGVTDADETGRDCGGVDCGTCHCGDGIFTPALGEQCDDANASNTDDCLVGCIAPTCGDGFVRSGHEDCDTGGVSTSSCDSDCTAPRCGDGIVNPAAGESDPECSAPPDQCHAAGSCDAATGLCTYPNKPNGTSCNDGNPCTQTDTCQAGVCTGASPVVCTASDQCHIAGVCDPATGVCSNPNKANGSTCNDANACTQTDTCQSGTCTGSNPVVCTASDQCHVAGTCNPSTGVCTNPPKGNGNACNDANACTQTDTCQSGVCTGSNPVVCTASDQCHVAGTCNTSTGVCTNPNKANGTTCNDANACTRTDTCQSGTCTGGNPVVCTASDQCHNAGTCNTTTGVCTNPSKTNGTACNDANACTINDSCQSGTCTSGGALNCNDNNTCTADTCNTGTGCVHTTIDTDGDGTPNCSDGCPSDPNKTVPGLCGCGVAETPVVFTVPADVNTSICPLTQAITIGQATLTYCNASQSVTGAVISTNGVTLNPTIPVTSGQATLGVGAHVVRWTPANTTIAPRTQNVRVRATIEANESFLVDDRGEVKNQPGGYAAVLNRGIGQTRIGLDAHTAGIASVGAVTLQDRSIIDGNVSSASTITVGSQVTVNGTQTPNTSINLLALPTLPTFPTPTGGSATVNSGVTFRPAAGSYTTLTVNSAGTLVLPIGDIYIQSLLVNAGGIVRVASTTSASRLFVRDSLTLLSSILPPTGTTVQPIYLGFAGTNLALDVRFDGTLVAPSAWVTFGTGAGLPFTGGFYARIIEVRNDSDLICMASRAAP